jgi:hypothetical protein
MFDLLDLIFAGTPHLSAVRDLRYGAANGDFPPADALRPDWTTLRSLLQQPSTGIGLQYRWLPSSLSWSPARAGRFGMQAGFGAIGGAPNYGATLPAILSFSTMLENAGTPAIA